ncbi:MauE/DoxX family redox-associated membrane protein [Paenibacillus sp. GCM10027627]|uniref:MauE/DoxX family redox-associated membrane protein n=1 Tax=unclassified Paenibacillus TaxID=185978 RepID=UPI00362E00DA
MPIETAIALVVCTIFVYSSISKIISYRSFEETIAKLQFPKGLASVVIAAELVVPALLLIEPTNREGKIGVLLLVFAFCFAAVWAIVKKLNVPCNCFGESTAELLGWGTIIRLLPLLLGGVAIAYTDSRISLMDLQLLDVLSTVFIAIGVVTIYSFWNNKDALRVEGTK